MNNISMGKSWYNALQLTLEQRLKHGLSLLVSYTASKTMEATSFLNSQDTALARELVSFDVPQRLAVSGIYEFPVGRKERWLNHGVASYLVGDWQFNFMTILQSGTPMSYPDYYIYGNPKLESGQSLNRWFDTSKDIWVQRPPDTLRVTPQRSPNIRTHTAPQVNAILIREFPIREGHQFQLKVSAFNATNCRFSERLTRARPPLCSASCRSHRSICRAAWKSAFATRSEPSRGGKETSG